MQTKTISAFEARRTFGKLIDLAGYKGESIVVEKNGERLAAIVPVEMLDEAERRRVLFFDQVRKMQQAVDMEENKAVEYVTTMVKKVRSAKKKAT